MGDFLGKKLNTSPGIAVGAQHELRVFMDVEAMGLFGLRIIQQSREIGWRWSGRGRRTDVRAGDNQRPSLWFLSRGIRRLARGVSFLLVTRKTTLQIYSSHIYRTHHTF